MGGEKERVRKIRGKVPTRLETKAFVVFLVIILVTTCFFLNSHRFMAGWDITFHPRLLPELSNTDVSIHTQV